MPADLEKLAYESALRALDKQERLVEELRARAGVVLAASSLAVSFLGGRALGAAGLSGLAVFSIACFALASGAAIVVLLPNDDLSFSMPGAAIAGALFEFGDKPDELYRRAADALDRLWEENDATIGFLGRLFTLAAGALGLEVVALAALIGGTII